jgi:hypothetical protein
MKKTTTYYEALLRRLRRDPRLFEEGSKATQISRLVNVVKRRCQPAWEERARRLEEARLERWFAIQ